MEEQSAAQPLKPLILRELIKEKNETLARRLPRFVYRYLNRKLHIEEVNEIIKNYGHLDGIDFIDSIVRDFKIKFTIKGAENLPKEGRFILASNHPLGGFDGMLLLSEVTKLMGESRFLARDELTKIPPLKRLFIPINKHGSQRGSASLIRDAYDSDYQILIFPSGLASRKIKGKITDLKWHKHFIQKSRQHQRDIIPIHIQGRNSNWFYRIANLRKFLGIKFNIEMFLLPEETFKQRGKSITITFGKPIAWETLDKSKSPTEWANHVKDIVYSMGGDNE